MKYLSVLVFTTGAVTLGMELSASRLLEPAFGNNQIVWASLIGLILLYLAIGAWLGGLLADRFPHQRALDITITLAALGVAIIPTLSKPVLGMAANGLDNFAVGLLVSALIAVALLFSIPGILLGTASPWAVRLAVRDLGKAGKTAGRLYAIATIGSIVGTFLPVLWFIPAYGTRWTFYLLAIILLSIISLGAIRQSHRWIPLAALLLVLVLAWSTQPGSAIRATWDSGQNGEIIYEDESSYNYIAVRQWGPERHLKLNDGVGIHSVYHPQMPLSKGIWDYFLLAPLFNPPPAQLSDVDNVLLIGLAAGTVSELITNIYGPIPITGIELDPQIIEVGQQYFNMNQPNLTAIAADGRHWLSQQPADAKWDLITIDAYRPPYIPFHLTTVEFFETVHAHLNEDGVVAINVGRTENNFALIEALSTTLAAVFPSIHIIDEPGAVIDIGNSLIVATVQPTQLENFATNVATLLSTEPPSDASANTASPISEFYQFAQESTAHARPATISKTEPIWTDDKAPVEEIVHGIIWDFMKTQ